MKGPVVVLSSVGRAEDALRLAEALVSQRLAACVSVVPGLRSVYRWKGEVRTDDEVLLVVKTRGERLPALKKSLVGMHPYDLPEAIALEVADGHAPYLEWIGQETGAARPRLRRPPAPAPRRPRGPRRPRSPR